VNAADLLEAIAEADLDPLNVEADLTARTDSGELRVSARADTLLVEISSASVALTLARRSRAILPAVADVLAAADLTAGIAIDGTGVAVIGADAEPGPLARRVGPHVEIRESEVLKTLIDAALGR
jgi:hypothetical protein